MQTVHRFLVAIVVPALIVMIFAVSSVAAHGSDGKVELCHFANHQFVKITVSVNAEPAHLRDGDVKEDEYGDCSSDQSDSDEDKGDSDDSGGSEANEGSQHEGQENAGVQGSHSHRSNGSNGQDD